ncbi:hypothetical protein [Neisseria sp. oral taxon 014]|uniref:hypothetical protein n=1 Tax=Neisseria sp. oral taxon 014 TaxID=641148 RepID=UPI0025F6773F|nr:hypothetical protein [Neisseria sp. oral taxon 014]
MDILASQTEQLFDGFLRFDFVPEAAYSGDDKVTLVKYYLSVREDLDTSLSPTDYNDALREKLYAKAGQLLAAH